MKTNVDFGVFWPVAQILLIVFKVSGIFDVSWFVILFPLELVLTVLVSYLIVIYLEHRG